MEAAVHELHLFGSVHETSRARLPATEKPILLVVADTEEEFDWSKPHDRNSTDVTAMPSITRAQSVFDEFGIRPCYVVDFPVVAVEQGYAALRDIQADGRCEIGAHLHPWVSPPHEEQVCTRHSFPGNLPAELEESKLHTLNERITEIFGAPAKTYKAGRYGIGPSTGRILERLGFDVDLSVVPDFDYSGEEGPDFSGYPYGPYWFGVRRRMLCVPATSAIAGFLGSLRRPVYRLANRPPLRRMKMPGILSRLGAADRLHLSNEGYSVAENIKLTRWLHARGERVFTYSFHSPSVVPGHTPYVRTDEDLQAFLDGFRRYFEFFFGELGGVTMTPSELRRHLAKGCA
ncbi:MAG: polysaccharide deacetylase family protein [Planctomycetota bacterium]|nr:polysaccharide deacetylase family protein [Planctomycetota bacterium]